MEIIYEPTTKELIQSEQEKISFHEDILKEIDIELMKLYNEKIYHEDRLKKVYRDYKKLKRIDNEEI